MTNGTNNAAAIQHQCWSCRGEVAPTDAFCRHCGMKLASEGNGASVNAQGQPISPNAQIYARLESIEKLLLKTIIGVVALLLPVGWVVLQTHHFGRD